MGAFRARLLAANPAVSEVFIADLAPERAWAARTTGVRALPDVPAVFAEQPDAMVVASATDAHSELVRRCIAAAIPCFCEKPLALEVGETRLLRDLVHETGARLQVGFQRRFDREFQYVRRQATAGHLGVLRRLHLTSADAEPPPPSFLEVSGGIFRDLSVHDFDMARWVTSREVLTVQVFGSDAGTPAMAALGDVHNAVCLLVLDGDVMGTLHASRDNGGGHDVRLELAGTRGTAVAGLGPGTPLRSVDSALVAHFGASWSGFLERFAPAYAREMEAFVDFVVGGGDSPCGVDDAFEAMCVAVAAQRSLRTGQPVPVAEVRNPDSASV
jgi:myo-inositol 2-dehydrogenase/D-chiro-inositol 1-dehydrogenase